MTNTYSKYNFNNTYENWLRWSLQQLHGLQSKHVAESIEKYNNK